jgi:hypothetical protein
VIACDLDGTLAHYDGWVAPDHIGAVIPAMQEKVLNAIAMGETVVIFTARVTGDYLEAQMARDAISKWLAENNIPDLEVTGIKLKAFHTFWDDRAVEIIKNTGLTLQREY